MQKLNTRQKQTQADFDRIQEEMDQLAIDVYSKEDEEFVRDIQKAEEFKIKSGYNPALGLDNQKNSMIMAKHKVLVLAALQKAGERLDARLDAVKSSSAAARAMKDQQK